MQMYGYFADIDKSKVGTLYRCSLTSRSRMHKSTSLSVHVACARLKSRMQNRSSSLGILGHVDKKMIRCFFSRK